MEGVSVKVYKGLKAYYTKRQYYTRLEVDPIRKKRKWGIKIGRKIRIRFSPKTFVRKIRDGYVNFMLRLTNPGLIGGPPCNGFGSRPIKEYDEKMIIEIYKSILNGRDQPKQMAL